MNLDPGRLSAIGPVVLPPRPVADLDMLQALLRSKPREIKRERPGLGLDRRATGSRGPMVAAPLLEERLQFRSEANGGQVSIFTLFTMPTCSRSRREMMKFSSPIASIWWQ